MIWRDRIWTAGLICAGLTWLGITMDLLFAWAFSVHESWLGQILLDDRGLLQVAALAWIIFIFIALHGRD